MARDLIIAAQLCKGDVIKDFVLFPELTDKTVDNTARTGYGLHQVAINFTDGTYTELRDEQLIYVLSEEEL